ncbi:MAG: EAL domain-containing protein [Rhodocyclales bacterium]|nr:EAL domain-containing protein [Rhodocyclales bacterium]
MVLIVSLGVFLLATAGGVIHQRNKALADAHEQARSAVVNGMPAVSIALWNYDQPGWSALLEGMTRVPSIARIELSDMTKVVADVRSTATDHGVASVWSAPVMAPDGKSQIGSLRVSESTTAVERQTAELISTLIATELTKIAGLAFILFVIVYWQVARHLYNLAKDVVQLDPNNLDARVGLHRGAHDKGGRDELDILVTAINGFLDDRAAEMRKRLSSEAELRRSETKFRTLYDANRDAVWLLDDNGSFLDCNQAALELFGSATKDALYRKRPSDLSPAVQPGGMDSVSLANQRIVAAFERGSLRFEWMHKRGDTGETFPAEVQLTSMVLDGKPILQAVVRDITERKSADDEIKHLAFYDYLTHLPNRRLMLDRLGQALASSARHGGHGAVMMIDLDNFKTLNDTMGHDIGDRLLIDVAARLKSCVREGDTIARMGGDEFLVLLEDLDEGGLAAMQAENVARKILLKLDEPYWLDATRSGDAPGRRSHQCTSSIGITLFRGQSVTTDELMKRADTAMYHAKSAGRNTLRFFDPEMQAAAQERASLELDLRKAIDEEQFLLYYQAQVDAADRVIGAEALLRWGHPERGLVSPAEFIPRAESTGLILPLGQQALTIACTQLALWATRPETEHLTLAVNVSARQFKLPDFVDQVLEIVDSTGARPERLKLELTESLLLENSSDIIAKMNALKACGVGFSLDDFGTGYSSLSYLKRLPLDQLKIDQSFVSDILTDPNDAAIARTIVALGQTLGLAVIAEGVETRGQRDFLARNGCLAYQGFFFSRPVPVADFEALIARTGN